MLDETDDELPTSKVLAEIANHPALQADAAAVEALKLLDMADAGESLLRGRILELTAKVEEQHQLLLQIFDVLQNAVRYQDNLELGNSAMEQTGGMAGLDAPVLGPSDLAAFLNVSTSTIDRMRKRGDLPEPIQLSERKPAWTVRQAVGLWLDGKCRRVEDAGPDRLQ